MQVRACSYHSGPNMYGWRPCAVATLDLDAVDAEPVSAKLRAKLYELSCQLPASARVKPFRFESTTLPALCAEATLVLQGLLACPVRWSKVLSLQADAVTLAFDLMRPRAANEVLACALTLLDTARGRVEEGALYRAFEVMRDAMVLRLRHFVSFDRRETAARLGIETFTGHGMHHSHIRLGLGSHSALLTPGYSDATSYLAKSSAGDKSETYALLAAAGLPVARQHLASSEAAALAAIDELGFPLVVKPARSKRGRGVAVNLCDSDAVLRAYGRTLAYSDSAVVEQCLLGDDYRLLVIGGKLVAALRRPAPSVTGNGRDTVAELIAQANARPERDGVFLDPLSVDAEVMRTLDDQGLKLDAVPTAGSNILIRRAATPESPVVDVTDEVHPDNRAVAVLAAQVCGLDIAGIDFISKDIGVSWRENRAGIVEVNAGPGVDLHMYPQLGKPREISRYMIRHRIPARTAGRIPSVMVTGYHGKQETARYIYALLALLGRTPGRAGEAGDAPVYADETQSAANVAALFANKTIGTGIFTIAFRELAQQGSPLHYPTIAVLTDDRVQRGGTEAPEQLLRLIAELPCQALIVDGRRPTLRALAALRPAWQTGWIGTSQDMEHESLAAHLAAGGWCVAVESRGQEKRGIVWRSGSQSTLLADLPDAAARPSTILPTRSLLSACAVAVALGISPEAIGRVLHVLLQIDPVEQGLIANGVRDPMWVACDPRRPDALAALVALGSARHRTWLMVTADRWVAETATALAEALGRLSAVWCLVGPHALPLRERMILLGIAPASIQLYPDFGLAQTEVGAQALPGDLLALLDIDETARLRWCPKDSSVSETPLIHEPALSQKRWSASELAEIFDGSWVSGPLLGWGVDAVVGSDDADPAGKLAVIAGATDSPEAIEQIERRIHLAFANGAKAVVSRWVPADLPRWRPVLVCDDPLHGLRRLLS